MFVVEFVIVLAGKRAWERDRKDNRHISTINFYNRVEFSMAILLTESKLKLWEALRLKLLHKLVVYLTRTPRN